jgi:3-methylfumaryl-CoA hydratase
MRQYPSKLQIGFCRSAASAPTRPFAEANNVGAEATYLRERLNDDMAAQPSSNGKTSPLHGHQRWSFTKTDQRTVELNEDMSMNTPTTLDAAQVAHLRSWEGRSETLTDEIVAAPLRGQSALLDRDDALQTAGSEVPPLWHWLYFLPQARQSQIGPDGHPLRGGFLPPVPLPRRMWAGGRLQWQTDNPLRVGDAAQKHSRIASVKHKSGRTGDLLFVEVEHAFSNAQGLCLTETHDIVYRAAAIPGAPEVPPTPVETGAPWQREFVPDPVSLFRYSALTFNGHRIHYDRSYVTQEEGYPGLIVHGPLIATLLVDLVRRQIPEARVASFQFRAVRPTFDLHPFRLNGRPSADGKTIELWACDHEGWLTMQAQATLA